MIRPCWFWMALMSALAAAPAGAQTVSSAPANGQEAPPPASIPTFRTNANLVIVDVVVRDHGKPVEGLHASDFHLFEDGRAQKIAAFEESKATDALRVAAAPENLPPHTYSDAPRYAVTSAANVLLLDALNTPLSDQVLIRRKMIEYLHTIPPGTRIAVFTLGSRLRIIAGFSTDPAAIEKAFYGRGNPEKSPVLDPAGDQAMSELANLAGYEGGINQIAMTQFSQDNQIFEAQLRASMTLDALRQLDSYLATIPGRKNVIWFTGSMPFSLVSGAAPNLDAMADLQDQTKQALELSTVARVALYPVDARGLFGALSDETSTQVMNPNLFNSVQAVNVGPVAPINPAALEQNTVSSAGTPGETTAQVVQENDRVSIDQMHSDHLNMEAFAEETGGKAFFNTNGLGQALPAAIANGSDYYTIAYAPDNNDYNGAYRKIAVKLTEGHYDLEYRRGYFAINPEKADHLFTGLRNPLVDAMQRGSVPLSQVRFQVRVLAADDPAVAGEKLAPEPAGALARTLKPPLTRYVLDYTIDPQGFAQKPLPNGEEERQVEVTQVAYSPDGQRLNYTDGAFGVDRGSAVAMRPIPMHQEIDLPAGAVFLRIGVRDMISGRIGTLEIPLQVDKSQRAAR